MVQARQAASCKTRAGPASARGLQLLDLPARLVLSHRNQIGEEAAISVCRVVSGGWINVCFHPRTANTWRSR